MRGERLGLRRGEALSDGALAAGQAAPLTAGETLRQWWPLAGGWVLMTAELSVFSAIVARLPDPAVQLAAWGVVFSLSTLVQAPSTSLLPAATALAKDRASFAALARYGGAILLALTAVHALVAMTPAYDLVVRRAMGVPPEVADAGRAALLTMLPWTFGTGARRFLQGVMIRSGDAGVVMSGAMLRLGLGAVVMLVGMSVGALPGALMAATAIIVAVYGELAYNLVRFLRGPHGRLPEAPPGAEPLGFARFFRFYMPLVVTTVLTMFAQTLVTVALGRMPRPLESLAAWPVLYSFLVILQGPALAFTEVAISLLDRRGSDRLLGRVAWAASGALTLVVTVVAATPLARLWFGGASGLDPALAGLAVTGLWLGLTVPGLRLATSWYQGVIIHGQRTRAVLESVVAFLGAGAGVLVLGVAWGRVTGLYVGVAALTAAMLAQAGWLAYRAGAVLRERRPVAGSVAAP